MPILTIKEKIELAKNPATAISTLESLAAEPDNDMRAAVSLNPTTPTETLTKLFTDTDWLVRCGVAEHQNTSPEILTVLATDSEENVRYAVASNSGFTTGRPGRPVDTRSNKLAACLRGPNTAKTSPANTDRVSTIVQLRYRVV